MLRMTPLHGKIASYDTGDRTGMEKAIQLASLFPLSATYEQRLNCFPRETVILVRTGGENPCFLL